MNAVCLTKTNKKEKKEKRENTTLFSYPERILIKIEAHNPALYLSPPTKQNKCQISSHGLWNLSPS